MHMAAATGAGVATMLVRAFPPNQNLQPRVPPVRYLVVSMNTIQLKSTLSAHRQTPSVTHADRVPRVFLPHGR